MLVGTQSLPNILSTFTPFEPIFSGEHSPKKQVLLAHEQPLQPEFVDTAADTESEVKWLVIPFLLIILSLPVVGNETENGGHKLEVYATIKHTNWKFMLR